MALAYDESGQGPAVVLLHAFPLDRTLWHAQRAALAGRYRVIVPDLPGHGRSPRLAGAPTIDGMADEVARLLDRLNLPGPIVLGGISMGGYVALSFAAQHGDRLRGLMLFDTKSVADTPDAAAGRERSAGEIEAGGSIDPLIDGMIPRLFAESTRSSQPELVSSLERVMRTTDPASVVSSLRALATRADRTADLRRMSMPALVCVGERDAISPPEEMRQMAESLPCSRFVVIPEAGHLSPAENPQAVTGAIGEFLSTLRD